MAQTDIVAELSNDDARYRMLVDGISDYAIYMLDTEGLVASWNTGAQRFKGYTADEIIGHHFATFYTVEDRAEGLPAKALKTARDEGRFECEGWRVRKDGGRFWAHVVIDPIRAESGALVGYAKITRDLSERADAARRLDDSEQQFRMLVQGVTDYAIYMLDPDGRVTSWNSGAQRIKGYTAEEIIGEHFSKFYTAEDRAADRPAIGLATAVRDGRWEHEGWRVRKDGSRFRAHVVIDPIRSDDGVVIGFAKVTRDITERERTQEELEQAREALFQSQKLDAIGKLTGGIAHDFNNLLAAILGSLELLQKRLPFDPRLTPLLMNAIEGAHRGAGLTQRMLAFARRQELALQPVDLAALVEGMRNFLRRSIGPEVEIVLNLAPGLRAVMTDANQLESALLNLVVNARDAMPEGGEIVIEVRECRPEDRAAGVDPENFLCLVVSDSGEGMDEATARQAVEPFFTTKGVGRGTGLGLSMVQGLIAQSGGAMRIESEKGIGTAVKLWLPIAAGDAVVAAVARGDEPVGETEAKRLLILAVDDDPLVLMNTGALLEDLGHDVLEASSPEEALDLFRANPGIDLVITDQAMPKMTGLELAERLRAERPELPVVIATGYAELPEGSTLDVPRLPKPFTQAMLQSAVTAAIGGES
jgi:PAS domain S-box-containing protein